jgi:hypothetical protein
MSFLNIICWVFFATYVLHILDETLLNGGFVQWIAHNFWPTYHMRMFFWFNAAFIAAISLGNLLFEALGGHWIILPIIFIAGFATHTITVHLYWSIRLNTYSPGLLTSSLYILIFYILTRYGLFTHLISAQDFATGTAIGVLTLGLFLTVGPTLLFPKLMKRSN